MSPLARSPIPFLALDEFTQAFVTAACWTEDTDPQSGEYFHGKSKVWNWGNMSTNLQVQIINDCGLFQQAHAAALKLIPFKDGHSGASQAGHDYWLTRNGHGAGFWDRDYAGVRVAFAPKGLGNYLTQASKQAGEMTIYIGDDGKLYA